MPCLHTSFETSPLLSPDSLREHNVCNAGHEAHNISSETLALSNASDSSKRALAFRIGAAMYSFTILGLFTSSLGVLLPHLESYYHLTDVYVSLIFLVGPVGYILAAQSTDFLHRRFGQRGIASLGPFFHLLAAAIISTHPPFWMVLMGFSIVTLGTGLLDSSWCAWAGGMGERANTVSGMLHGSFSVGVLLGRYWWRRLWVLEKDLGGIGIMSSYVFILIVSHTFLYLRLQQTGVSLLEVVVLPLAFRHENSLTYLRGESGQIEQGIRPSTSKAMLRHRATWMSSLYFLAYVGTESAISGWIVSFLSRARDASPEAAALSLSGFWTGMAIGRISLGVVTDYIGVARATTIYLSTATVLEVLFAVLTSVKASIVLATGVGFLMGPLFPSGVVLLTSLLPRQMHVSAVSFVASVGQVGGALLPFIIGTAVQGLGIHMFKYVVVVQLSVALGIWLLLLGVKKEDVALRDVDDNEREEQRSVAHDVGG